MRSQPRPKIDRWERWYPDELGLAGAEHLDAEFVAGYDRKQQFDPSADVALLGELGIGGDVTVVDLGAGTGTFALAAAAAVGEIVAVDISPVMVDVLRRRVTTSNRRRRRPGSANGWPGRPTIPQSAPPRRTSSSTSGRSTARTGRCSTACSSRRVPDRRRAVPAIGVRQLHLRGRRLNISSDTFPAVANDFDLVVIGSGPAGDKGASQAAYFGHSVAVVERRKDVGGAAIEVSGVPVKALRDTAVYLTGWSRRDVYGVGISLAPDLVMNRLRARITDVVTTMQAAVAANFERHGVELVHGTARLEPGEGGRLCVVVTDDDCHERRLSARRVLLATGSRPFHPADVPFDDPDVYDSEGILAIDRLPEHLLVVGGGAVGAEYASIFADLGSRVTVVTRGRRLLPMLDHDICEALADSMRASGARILFGQTTSTITRDDDGLLVRVGDEGLRPDAVLHAGGRCGNVEHLDLDAVGVVADDRGRVQVDERFETTCPGIYAAGDVIGPPGLASVAMESARVAMCRAFDIPFKEHLDNAVPTGIYTLPEVSMVGLTEEDARRDDACGDDVEIGIAYFAGNARAMIAGSTDGLVKLVFRASDKTLLGAHIFGEEATELIHVAQAVLHRGGTIDEFIDTTFNFPTRADAYKYAAYDGLQRLRRTTT